MKLSKLIEALQKLVENEPSLANVKVGFIVIGMIEALVDRRLL